MTTDSIREAMATVNRHLARPVGSPGGALEYDAYQDACELLARWLVANVGELVRVRGLEWKEDEKYLGMTSAKTIFGRLFIWGYSQKKHREWFLEVGSLCGECDSLADGKTKAEQWYRAHLAAALEPIFGEGGK